MTLYLAKHGSSDYRLHQPDGTEMASWSERPGAGDMAVAVSDHHGNPSKGRGGPPAFIRDDKKLSTGDLVYRDLTNADETVPWR